MAWSRDILKRLVEGDLDPQALLELQRAPKDEDRFDMILALEQERVPWSDKIVLVLQEHLYIVEKPNGDRLVKCACGYEFGPYTENWKEYALVYALDTDEKLEEVFRGPRKPDPDWFELREYYCPGCGTQLEVESAIPGYPPIFDFLPDFEAWEARRK
jgi:acetone carboxylase, gamma subunit